MYSSSDYEQLFIRYKAEAVPHGISIQKFCQQQNVPYNLFEKWYRDTRHRIVPIKIDGREESDSVAKASPAPAPSQVSAATQPSMENSHAQSSAKKEKTEVSADLRFMVDIHVTNGLHLFQKNLSYRRLKELVEKLEVLC